MSSTFAPLTTRRLILRPLAPADADSVFRYRSDSNVSRFQCWEPGSLEEVQTFIADLQAIRPDTPGTWFQLAIILHDGTLIGDLGLRFPGDDRYQSEVGITIAPEFQGVGYATEALRAALDYLFRFLGKHRVFASVGPRNSASLRLLEGIGMRREAHFRQSLRIRGEWVDDLVFALLRSEWATRNPG